MVAAYAGDPAHRDQAGVGVSDFCFGYPTADTRRLFADCGLRVQARHPGAAGPALVRAYAGWLAAQPEECLFLYMDSFEIGQAYRQLTGRGFGLPLNRRAICGSENDYLLLFELFYQACEGARDRADFERRYYAGFRSLIRRHSGLARSARHVAHQLAAIAPRRRLLVIDVGFQFTFALFCWASVRRFEPTGPILSYHAFTVYPWLRQLFAGCFFTGINRNARAMEARGKKRFLAAEVARAEGAFLGFAIGDALGAPVAGLTRQQAGRMVGLPLNGFAANPTHPLLGFLRPGQHTGNTRLLRHAADWLARDETDLNLYVASLVRWGAVALREPREGRWLGPTTAKALRYHTDHPGSIRAPGATTSCAAIYRVVPFAVGCAPLVWRAPKAFARLVAKVVAVTHDSKVSRLGGVIYAQTLAHLLLGALPETALQASLAALSRADAATPLARRCRQALEQSGRMTVTAARKAFGTSSDTAESLPLSLVLFLQFTHDFRAGVLAAANSVRTESPRQRRALAAFPFAEQLVEAKGGNTDGIAALTGALLGASGGVEAIPRQLVKRAESTSALIASARALVRSQRIESRLQRVSLNEG
jgi:ADP-ribosylglycohydrolase